MKYGKSPPDEGDNQETLEASGPLWQAVARLIDDEESAHEMHCQLQRAMVTRGLAEALSQEQQRQHVAKTSKVVVVELDKRHFWTILSAEHALPAAARLFWRQAGGTTNTVDSD